MKVVRVTVFVGMAIAWAALASPALASCDMSQVRPVLPGRGVVLRPSVYRPGAAPAAGPRLIPVALAVPAGPPAPPAPPGAPAPPPGSIVGLWLGAVTIDGQPFAQGYESFSSDGLETLYDTSPPASGNVCLGVWATSGAGPKATIKLKHPAWNFDNDGNVVGTTLITEQLTLDPGGNSFHGTVGIDIYDATGAFLQHLDGEVTASRITVN